MKSFMQFIEEVDFTPLEDPEEEVEVEPAPAAVAAPAPYSIYSRKVKPWKANKKETLQFWESLVPNIPLQLKAIDPSHKGTNIQEDGIRLTGSREFIATVLSRLKDLLYYESEKSKLIIDYRQNAKSLKPGGKDSYLFYINVKNRA